MKKIFILLLSIFLLTGCSVFKSDALEDIDVYTTTYPINYLVSSLYGEHSKVHSIYPAGVNFKEYTLSDKKINEYAKSSLFVFNSQDIEREYAIKMINENSNLKLIDTAFGMEYDYSIEELWLNPYNYLMMAKNIKDSLNEYLNNPYLIEKINENYNNLQYELSRLDAKYQEKLNNSKYQVIVTDNSLFKYLEKYNIEVISLEENIITITLGNNDTLSDISNKYNISISDILTYNNKTDEIIIAGEELKIPIKVIENSDVNKVKKLISEGKIKYIYSNNNETNNTVKKIIEDNDLELITFNTLYSIDGGTTNNNETYLTIMNDNLDLLEKELNK